jgi:hypothetical protein
MDRCRHSGISSEKGINNALVHLHNPFLYVVAWHGDFLHLGRIPAHPIDTRDSGGIDPADSRPPTFLGLAYHAMRTDDPATAVI